MKARTFVLFVIASWLLASCSKFLVLQSRVEYPWKGHYELANEQTTVAVDVPVFNKIWIVGDFDADISFDASSSSVKIEGDKNLIGNFRYYVVDGELRLHFKDVAKGTRSKLKVWVSCSKLDSITKMGKGKLQLLNELKSNNFSFSQSGSGTAFLKLNAENASISQTGSGKIFLSGRTLNLHKKISGSGEIREEAIKN